MNKNLNELTEKEKDFFDLKFGNNDGRPKSISEVAQMLNMTIDEAKSYYKNNMSKYIATLPKSESALKEEREKNKKILTKILVYSTIFIFFSLPVIPNGLILFKIIFELIIQIVFAVCTYHTCKHLFKIKDNHIIAIIILAVLVVMKIVGYPPMADAQTLEGGIRKIETAQQAKEYVFKYTPLKMVDPTPYKAYASQAPEGYRADYSDGGYSVATGNKMLSYNHNNKLTYIAVSDKNILDFPRKLQRYEYPSGKLIEITYGTSMGNGYIFRPDGSLLGIWENGVYREGEKLINVAKISQF